jgi:hypothetical protein
MNPVCVVEPDSTHSTIIKQLKTLKQEFDEMVAMIENIAKIKSELIAKNANLKTKYEELIKTNNKHIFVFCLDSLFFQYKLFMMELESLEKYWSFIYNRVYCDYYKLYGIVLAYIKQNRSISVNETHFPNYRHLDIYHEYPLADVKNIHSRILQFMHKLEMVRSEKHQIILVHIQHNISGMALMNFLNTLKYENTLLEQEIMLYMNYLSFFHMSQRSQITGFMNKLEKFRSTVESNMNNLDTFVFDNVVHTNDPDNLGFENNDSKPYSGTIDGMNLDPDLDPDLDLDLDPDRIRGIQNNKHNESVNIEIAKNPSNQLIDLFSF